MYCNNCGYEDNQNNQFCPNCGASLRMTTPPTMENYATPPEKYTPPQAAPQPQYSPSVDRSGENRYAQNEAVTGGEQWTNQQANPASTQQWNQPGPYEPQYNQPPQQPIAAYQQPPQQPPQQMPQTYNVNSYPSGDEVLCGAPKVFSIISLVCGIISMLSCYMGILFGIAAIVFSCVAKSKFKGKNTMGKLGMIFGIVGICLGIISIGIVCCTACVSGGNGSYPRLDPLY